LLPGGANGTEVPTLISRVTVASQNPSFLRMGLIKISFLPTEAKVACAKIFKLLPEAKVANIGM
jgi:hypothetical protein